MPYIKKEDRVRATLNPQTVGELNYAITQLINKYADYMEDHAPLDKMHKGYQLYNDVIGALECCKLEVYRRVLAPYEDKKIRENGDVF